jgi:hypothetical protein
MGHLNQLQKNLHSTCHRKWLNNKEVEEFDQDVNPENDSTANQAFAAVIDLHADKTPEGKSYLDLTGCFPSKSQGGNLYVLLLYTCDNNYTGGTTEESYGRRSAHGVHKNSEVGGPRNADNNALDGQQGIGSPINLTNQ